MNTLHHFIRSTVVTCLILISVPAHAQKKRDILGLSPGMAITETANAFSAFAHTLYGPEERTLPVWGDEYCNLSSFRQFPRPPLSPESQKAADEMKAMIKSQSDRNEREFGKKNDPPPVWTNFSCAKSGGFPMLLVVATRTYKPSTVYFVTYQFRSEDSSAELVANISEQFGSKSSRVSLRSVKSGANVNYFGEIWDLGDQTILRLTCEALAWGLPKGCAEHAPKGKYNEYTLDLFDLKLIALEKQAVQAVIDATPSVNPKPKF